MYLPDGNYGIGFELTTNWCHVMCNYIGPKTGQGNRIYADHRTHSMGYFSWTRDNYPPGDGNVVLGRYYEYFYQDGDPYIGAYIGELLFFNKTLNSTEVAALVNNV